MYDVIIVGAGAAGLAAGVYGAKSQLKCLVLAKNLPDIKEDSAQTLDLPWLLEEFKKITHSHKELLELKTGQEVIKLSKNVVSFSAETAGGGIFYAKTLVLTAHQVLEGDFENIIATNANGQVKVDAFMRTNIPGIFAAGGASQAGAEPLVVTVGQGAMAALSANEYLRSSALTKPQKRL